MAVTLIIVKCIDNMCGNFPKDKMESLTINDFEKDEQFKKKNPHNLQLQNHVSQ